MDTASNPGAERRRSPRYRVAKSTTRLICQRGELYLGPNLAESLEDASEEGLGMIVREALAVGERVSLSLEGIGLPGSVQRLGRMAWCEAGEGGLFRAGVELDSPLEYVELMAITSI